jgi:hypothetical protein
MFYLDQDHHQNRQLTRHHLRRCALGTPHLKEGDEVNIKAHSGGIITIVPVRPKPNREEVSKIGPSLFFLVKAKSSKI